jgi:hypothetical protein
MLPTWIQYFRFFDRQDAKQLRMHDSDKPMLNKIWKMTVEAYVQLELLYASDTLPAIAGCAKAISYVLDCTYVAGMWLESLPLDLLWYVKPPRKRASRKPRAKESTAPSWSWASLSMAQNIKHLDNDLVTEETNEDWWNHQDETWHRCDIYLGNYVKLVHCIPETPTIPFGRLKPGAFLKLDGPLFKWHLRSHCASSQPPKKQREKQGLYELYLRTKQNVPKCTTSTPKEAYFPRKFAGLEIYIDSNMSDEPVIEKTFTQCTGNDPRHPCKLIEIHLLHAMHKENWPYSMDVFLLLNRQPSLKGMPSSCRRIGLMIVRSKEVDGKSWMNFMRQNMVPLKREFWVF